MFIDEPLQLFFAFNFTETASSPQPIEKDDTTELF
jgi:hypothetical protein